MSLLAASPVDASETADLIRAVEDEIALVRREIAVREDAIFSLDRKIADLSARRDEERRELEDARAQLVDLDRELAFLS